MSTVISKQTFVGTPKPAGADNHAHAVAEDNVAYVDCTFDAAGASEALKASKRRNVDVIGGSSIGGVEDCHDYVRGGNLYVSDHTFHRGQARRDVTIKGGFRNAIFQFCPGLRWITAGDYTKYDAKALMPDGRVVTARPWKCCRPGVRGGCVVVNPDHPKVYVLNIHSAPWEGDVVNLRLPFGHDLAVAFYFWVRARFFRETNPAPEEEFKLMPEEL